MEDSISIIESAAEGRENTMNKYNYILSRPQFPYCSGWVEIYADTWEKVQADSARTAYT